MYDITELQADELITEIRELEADKVRYTNIARGKMENIQADLLRGTEGIDRCVQFNKDQLRAFFTTVNKKETKTQESYSLLSGRLIMKKATTKLKHDDKKIAEWAEVNASEYITIKSTSVLNWTEFKKDLVIVNGALIDKVTGEVLESIEGLMIEEVKESFEVKS